MSLVWKNSHCYATTLRESLQISCCRKVSPALAELFVLQKCSFSLQQTMLNNFLSVLCDYCFEHLPIGGLKKCHRLLCSRQVWFTFSVCFVDFHSREFLLALINPGRAVHVATLPRRFMTRLRVCFFVV